MELFRHAEIYDTQNLFQIDLGTQCCFAASVIRFRKAVFNREELRFLPICSLAWLWGHLSDCGDGQEMTKRRLLPPLTSTAPL